MDRVGRAILTLENEEGAERFNGNLAREVFLGLARLLPREQRFAQVYSGLLLRELENDEGPTIKKLRADLSYLKSFLGESGRTVDNVWLSAKSVRKNFTRFDIAVTDEHGATLFDTKAASNHYIVKDILGGRRTARIPVVIPEEGAGFTDCLARLDDGKGTLGLSGSLCNWL